MNNRRTQTSNVDGFVLRRQALDPSRQNKLPISGLQVPNRFLNREDAHDHVQTDRELPRAQESAPVLKRSEIDASLKAIDDAPAQPRHKRRFRLNKKVIKRIILVIIILIVLAAGFIGVRAFIASSKIFNGNIFDLLSTAQPLKTDQYGRSNIVIFGTSEDDPGHPGSDLTDSIMIVSIDQKNKNAAMVSVPRDLWVKYGQACDAGYEGRVNAVYSCYSDGGSDEVTGANALKDNIGDNFGMDIQYYAHVNYTVVKQVVDAVGGVEVTIQSSDPRGILDRNFDWKCGYRCYYVKYANGPTGTMDGEHALFLARARGDDNGQATYGLPNGNFDREKNQQKILTAIKTKATSAGTLSNPVAVTNLIDAMGNNVRTNFSGGEIKTLISLAQDIPTDKIKSVSLVEPGNSVVTTGNVSGQSIVRPVEGIYDFSGIRTYLRQKFQVTNANGEEAAIIDVLNGSSRTGVAGAKAEELTEAGFEIGTVGDTDSNNYPTLSWYDLSGGKSPKAAAKLKQELGLASSGTTLPVGVQAEGDFVIIIGDGTN